MGALPKTAMATETVGASTSDTSLSPATAEGAWAVWSAVVFLSHKADLLNVLTLLKKIAHYLYLYNLM